MFWKDTDQQKIILKATRNLISKLSLIRFKRCGVGIKILILANNTEASTFIFANRMENKEEIFPLNDLPKDILENILSFLSGKDLLLKYSLVNKEWNEIIDQQSLWHLKCERLGILFDGIVSHNHDEPFDFKDYFFHNPYTRNLLKNSKGTGK